MASKDQDHSRGTGRTKRMIEALPEDGAVVIVHNRPMTDYVRHMIIDVRGLEVAASCKVICITNHNDVWNLKGDKRPIHVDHTFWDLASSEAINAAYYIMTTGKA